MSSLTEQRSPHDEEASDENDKKLAKRMFLIGLLGLPWLWTVNAIYFNTKEGGLRSAEAIRWVRRSTIGAAISFFFLIIYIIYFQTTWRSWPAANYMVNIPFKEESMDW